MQNRVGGGGGKLSADTSFSAAADQHFVGGGGGISAANMSSCRARRGWGWMCVGVRSVDGVCVRR